MRSQNLRFYTEGAIAPVARNRVLDVFTLSQPAGEVKNPVSEILADKPSIMPIGQH
ncbi:hypothetical protein [Microcoleus sp. bin38.metabat.b11b12b14.051]|uniref:hypothetical protein n=1 Tax=Microcoleus sp. bin38.metabat.b11b12b14.051 TaxID=2742709 RepID=UPI0025FE0AD2|nr:hypothetical protein [Microcoleus sp. bin38.metabat.b11b12b14.051]